MDLYPAFLLLLLALSAQSQPLGNNGADNGSNGETKTVNCPPGSAIASGCSGTHCEASCGSEKVEMECPDEWININGSTVTCGKKPACFPFCDKEGQPIPMNNGGTSRQARSSGDQKTVDCPPGSSINGDCDGTQCVVTCGNGKKVEMECPEGGINITAGTATCGKKLEFPPCFPFCDKEGQPMNNGGTSRQARSSGDQKTVDCPPGSPINGTCVGTQCVVTCGNGKKVEMECPDKWININGSTATCGKKPACFPFCDKEGQPLKGCLPGSPGFPFC